MIETVIVVIFLSLTFLWLFQYANLFTTKLVLTHAAARADSGAKRREFALPRP